MPFLLGLLCIFNFAVSTDARAELSSSEKAIAESPEWHRLLHYKKTLFGKWESEVDGPGFFFSEKGKTDPEAELIASRDAMVKNIQVGKLKQPPTCAFPARYQFLKRVFALNISEPPCVKHEEFLKNFNAESATLVFSSSYPNNPGSMFGHTFLRINAKRDPNAKEKKLDILDYGIGYAAYVRDDENVILYMVLGLFGGYQGQFSMQPYYAKVTEYLNGESRDLWEYDLNLTPEQTRTILDHFWEIETNSYLDYYFFDENCAYHLLQVLNVARPDWNFGKFGPYVTPAESVKRLVAVPGAVQNIRFRPSLRKKLMRSYELLSPEAKTEFEKLRSRNTPPQEIQHPEALDAMSMYLLYIKTRDGNKLSPEDQALQRQILIRRSQLPDSPIHFEELNWNDPRYTETQPEVGHPTYRVGTASGERNQFFFQELNFKFALHDLLNEDRGYSPFTQIDFPGFKLRYQSTRAGENKYVRLESIDALAVTSLYPWSFLDKRFSWTTNLGYITPRDLPCQDCHVAHFDAGAGITLPITKQNWIVYSLASLQLEAGTVLNSRFRAVPRIELATLAEPLTHVKTQLSYRGNSDLFQSERKKYYSVVGANVSYAFLPYMEFRAGGELVFVSVRQEEWKLSLNYYF